MKLILRRALPIFCMLVIIIALYLGGGSETVYAADLRVMTVPANP